MKKLITILFMLFSIVSFSQPNIDAYRVRARNWIIYGNDTIFRPTHIDAADYQIKTVADPTDPQDAVNLRTMNDFAGDSTFTSIVIRDSLFIFSDTIIYITGGDSLVTKEYLDSLVATLPGGHDPVTLAPSATTGGLTISASQVVGFQPSTATANGYLRASDFTLFFNKLSSVTHDATLTGLGTVASPLKVDTTLIATKTDVTIAGDDWGTDYVILNSDSLLKGRGTTATPLRADSTLLATKAFTNLTYVQLGDSLTKWVTFKQLIDSLGTLPGGHDPVTLGTANGLSLSTQELSLNTANAETTGAILNTDWAEFNAKLDSVTTDITLTGYGTEINPLKVDTSKIATKYDLEAVVAGSVTLSGQVTGSGTGTIATVLDKTAITGQDLNASIATNDSILIYDQSGADLDKTSVANLGAVNGAFDAGWLQNVAVSSTAPFNNYILLYDSITTQWKPAVSPSSKWASDTYGINYQLGNVGIGTTSVSGNKLKVYTTSSMNAAALFEGGSTSHGIAIVSGNTSSHRALDLYNYTGSRNLMRITSDGSVNFPLYGTTSTFDGAVTKLLGVDATGAMYATSGFAGGEVTSVAGTYLNNQIPRFTGTSGDTLQTSPYPVTINDSGQLAVAATYSGDYGARFINNSSLGYGALIQGGNTAVQDILRLSSYGGTMQFQFKPTGTMYAHNLGTGKTDSVLYWNATTKQITVGDISSLGSKWSSVYGGINYPSGYVGINNATPEYALDVASTEDVAQLYSSNTKNNEQVLRLKLGGTGGDYLRMLNGSGVSYFNFHALGYFQQKSISTAPSAISGYGQWYTYNDKPTFMSGAGTVYNLMTDPLTTRGDIMYRSSTATTRLPIGSANTVLSSNGTDVSWQPGPWTDGGTYLYPASSEDIYFPSGSSISWRNTAIGQPNYIRIAGSTARYGIDFISDIPGGASNFPALHVGIWGDIKIADAYSLPVADGTNGQVLKTDGLGSVSWGNVTTSEVDGSISNEGSLTVAAGTGSTSVINSNTSGSTGVTLTAGTGLSISEAGNIITLTNSSPNQTVSIAGGGINTVTGTYPNFTITGTEVDGSTTNEIQNLSLAGAALSISGGTGVNFSNFSTSSTTAGWVPGSSGVGSTYFLNAAGTWSVPVGSGDMLKSTYDNSGTANIIDIENGGTGKSSYTTYALVAGGTTSTGNLQQLAGLGTAGQVLTSTGASSLPTWQNAATGGGDMTKAVYDNTGSADIIDVENGGTGKSSYSTYTLLAGGTTSTGNFQQVTGTGTSGQILTSNGTGALPSWQNATSGADNWGTQYVILNSDSLIRGRGTAASPLKADTTKLATQYDISGVVKQRQVGGTITDLSVPLYWGTTGNLIDQSPMYFNSVGKLTQENTAAGSYSAEIINASPTGLGLAVKAGGASSNILYLQDVSGTPRFSFVGSGKMYAFDLSNTVTSNTLYYNTSTDEITYGAAPSGGSGDMTKAVYDNSGTADLIDIENGGTNISSYTKGDLIYSSATNVLSKLAVSSDTSAVLGISNGVPKWKNTIKPQTPSATTGSVTLNYNLGCNMNFTTLTGNVTLTITNVPDGGSGTISVTHNGSYNMDIDGSTGYTTEKVYSGDELSNISTTDVIVYQRMGSNLLLIWGNDFMDTVE